MKHNLSFLLVMVMVVSLYSCQKEVEGTIPNNRVQNDSIFLDRLVVVDTTQPTGLDTIESVFFIYDNQKRLSKLKSYNTWSGTPDSLIMEFLYSGTDSLPYKHIVYESFLSLIYSDTIYYAYSNGVVVRDSIVSWELTGGSNSGAEVTEFSLSGSQVSIVEKFYNWVFGSYVLSGTDQGSVTISAPGGNILSQTRASGGAAFFDLVQASYDNNPNPISRAIKIRYPLLEADFFDCATLQRNNPVHTLYEEPGYPAETSTYSYIYRSDSYPIQRNYSSGSGGGFSKALYYYKSL